ncbi:ABC transporter permease [Kitasatospora sp. NBC_00240]|uniref:ABC transporter permease n=1 Tax=Kitasatospora sp. NBC_00240 TaxID=2903567 RepID=UPI00224D97C3|nr:ABC transporter permease [Kitasatospora sp. NBC_00240]MCX5210067.1 ABC transporter permease [Kitasatospora sp. NBC_00240]
MTAWFRGRTPRTVKPSRLSGSDLLGESLAGILQRPARSILTSLGTVLGVGTFVAILGLTATTSSQVDSRFNLLTATEVSIEDVGGGHPELTPLSFPADADARIQRLNGVEAAGVFWNVRLEDSVVRSAPIGNAADGERAQIVAASAGALAAAGPHLAQGRTFDAWHDSTSQPVVVIGAGTAARLGITTLDVQPAVFIAGQPFTVIGIVDDVRRKTDLLMSVTVPRGTAARLWGNPIGDRAKMIISTQIGAAQQIAGEAALALDPVHPENFRAVPPPDPRSLRTGVTSDLNQLFLLLAAICLVIGSVGIANTTLVAVLERTGEIGLRRALGARGRHITAQFLTESTCLGLLGGLIGTSLGVLTVLGVVLARDWTPVVEPVTVVTAPLVGLLTGLLAGLYPAWRAARIQPVEALRR